MPAAFRMRSPVLGIQWVHLQLRQADEEAWAVEDFLVLGVVTYHVADVLAEKAFDAPAKLLTSVDVFLEHTVSSIGFGRIRWNRECRDAKILDGN